MTVYKGRAKLTQTCLGITYHVTPTITQILARFTLRQHVLYSQANGHQWVSPTLIALIKVFTKTFA